MRGNAEIKNYMATSQPTLRTVVVVVVAVVVVLPSLRFRSASSAASVALRSGMEEERGLRGKEKVMGHGSAAASGAARREAKARAAAGATAITPYLAQGVA